MGQGRSLRTGGFFRLPWSDSSRARLPTSTRMALLVDAIAQHLFAEEIPTILKSLAEAFGDPDGGAVVRVDETDDAILPPDGEGMGQGGPGALGGVAVPPKATGGGLPVGVSFLDPSHYADRAGFSSP